MIQQETPEEYQKKREFIEAITGLDTKVKEVKSSQGYGKAYMWSILLPPIGIYYFVKFLFFNGGDKESVKAGVISLVLTLLSLFLSLWLMTVMFNSTPQADQQMLKQLTIPTNQKQLIQLYQ